MADTWQVESQRQTSILRGGSFEDAMAVTFKTASGVTGTITVPLSQYTAANVAKLIGERVEAIDAVHNVSPSSAPPPSSATSS